MGHQPVASTHIHTHIYKTQPTLILPTYKTGKENMHFIKKKHMKCWHFYLSDMLNSQEDFSNAKYYINQTTQKLTSHMVRIARREVGKSSDWQSRNQSYILIAPKLSIHGVCLLFQLPVCETLHCLLCLRCYLRAESDRSFPMCWLCDVTVFIHPSRVCWAKTVAPESMIPRGAGFQV